MKAMTRRTQILLSFLCIILLASALPALSRVSASKRSQVKMKTVKSGRVAVKSKKAKVVKAAPAPSKADAARIGWTGDGFAFEREDELELLGLNRAFDEALPEKEGLKRYDQPDQAMSYYVRKRLPEGETELPIEKYFVAQEQLQLMPQYSTAFDRAMPTRLEMAARPEQQKLGTWTPLGPGNIGGRTRAILINPQDPNMMYSAGVAGGVWKSTDAGASWTPLADLIANIAVCTLTFDPKNLNTIYAGTGEGYFAVDNVRGAGIFKSTDAGATWSRLAGTENSNFNYVNEIVVSPNESQRLYAATRTGVWRSLDGGGTWTSSLSETVQGGCYDLAVRTDQTKDYLFVACGNFQQATVYRNQDASASATWEPVLRDAGMGRTVIEIAPSNQSMIYALAAAISGPYQHGLHAFFRSTASGDAGSWEPRVRNTDPNTFNTAILSNPSSATLVACKLSTGNGFAGQSWYDMTIGVDPQDPNRVWAGGIDLYRTDDGGLNWGLGGFVYPNEGERRIHPDQHFIVFHPQYDGSSNQKMFVGNDGGIFRTDNARAKAATGPTGPCDLKNSDVLWTPLNNGYAVTQFYHGAVAPDGKSYFGGTQDNGTVRGTDAAGANSWKEINGADGGYSSVDFISPNILYASTQNTGIRKSTDTGGSFSSATAGISETGLFITPVIMDPSEPRRLYTGGGNLFRTSNGASLWVSAGSFRAVTSTGGGTISSIAIAPMDSNRVLVGLTDGSIVRTDRALTLSTAAPPSSSIEKVARPRAGQVSWVAFDPTNKDLAYATYSTFDGGAHVWRTIDGGQTWTAIDGAGATSIPNIPVHCIVVDQSNTARLYLGTDLGVFVSIDGGASWSVENSGFANTVTETLVLNVVDGVTTLYAFTHGRGAYKVLANQSGCSYSITPTTRNIGRDGGDAVVDVTAGPSGCNWNAASNVPWITLAPNSGGGATGSVAMKVEANKSLVARAGTVTIANRSFTVVQDAQPDLSPPVIAITNPTANPVQTLSGSINLLGTASDNSRVTSVSIRASSGYAATATLTASGSTATWTATVIPLNPGSNVITATATDDAGIVSAPATITVDASLIFLLATVAGTGTAGFSGDNGQAQAANIAGPISPIFDSAGNLFFCDFSNNRVRKVAPNGVITTVAGSGVAGFSGDFGPATEARLNAPSSVAIDSKGNLYISDRTNHRIRKVTAATGVITTVVGTGTQGFGGDGGGATAAFLNQPNFVSVDKSDNLYIADSSNSRIRRVAADTSVITTAAGTGAAGFAGDGGPATAAQLRTPFYVVPDSSGDLYIMDNGNFRLRKVTAASGVIATIAGTGSSGFSGDFGPAVSAAIGNCLGLALDDGKNIYIADTTNNRIRIITADTGMITSFAGSGLTGFSADGTGANGARLSNLQGVAVDPMRTVYFAEFGNVRLRKIVRALSADSAPPTVQITAPTNAAVFTTENSPITLGGTAADDTDVVVVRWSNDRGGSGVAFGTKLWTIPNAALQQGVNNFTVTAWDPKGKVTSAQLAVTYNPQRIILTIAGTTRSGNSGDGGAAIAADVAGPSAVALDSKGNVYFSDSTNRRVRKVSVNGLITSFAGNGDLGSSGDGGPAVEATFNFPRGVAVDSLDNVYIGDSNNHRIRKVDAGTGVITTVVGTGKGFGDFGGDGGPATQADLSGPQAIAFDRQDNLYIADRVNSRIRKVDAKTGIITTIAGGPTYSFSGDGGLATEAGLNLPTGIAVDAAGNIYISDIGNQRIRKISAADGKISTIAGTGMAGYNGDGGLAKDAQINLTFPSYLAVDGNGDVIFADRLNNRIRKITVSTGIITTSAGNGVAGLAGDGGSPLAANLAFPTGVVSDSNGNLYIADSSGNRIRKTILAADLKTVTTVSAASFTPRGEVAPDSIAAGFGSNLANSTQNASTIPLPLSLGGAAVKVRDALGTERVAPFFAATPGQVNYLIPNGTANGAATITLTTAGGQILTGVANVATVAPGLFAANMNGQGAAAAVVFRRKANGQESYEAAYRLDPLTRQFVSIPIDLGPEGDQVFLAVYGTGFRSRSSLANVNATINGVNFPVIFAGAAPDFIGLDQLNLLLDRSLIGKGEVDLVVMVDNKKSNNVRIDVK